MILTRVDRENQLDSILALEVWSQRYLSRGPGADRRRSLPHPLTAAAAYMCRVCRVGVGPRRLLVLQGGFNSSLRRSRPLQRTVQKGCAVKRGQKVLQTAAALAALAALAAADHRLPAAIFVLKKPWPKMRMSSGHNCKRQMLGLLSFGLKLSYLGKSRHCSRCF